MMADNVLATTFVGQIKNGFLGRWGPFATTTKVVWVALAARAGKDGECNPSVDLIQADTGLSRGVVCKAVQELRAAGEISVVHGGGRYGSKKYRFRTSSESKLVQKTTLTSSENGLALLISKPDTRTRHTSSCRKLRFDAADRATAEWMFGLITELDGNHKKPNLDQWANHIRMMREIDKRTDADIRTTFQWANRDSFWKSNILSPSKLREKFTTLLLKSTEIKNGNSKRSFPLGPGQRHGSAAAKKHGEF